MTLTILDDQCCPSCLPVSVDGKEKAIRLTVTISGTRQGARYELVEFFFLYEGRSRRKERYTGELVGKDIHYVCGTHTDIETLRKCIHRQQPEGG